MTEQKCIVIVMKPDKSFDCVHKNTVYNSLAEANKAIGLAEKEDIENHWDYSYRIVSVYEQVQP